MEIVEELNLEVIAPGQPGSSSAMTADQWKNAIRTAANDIDQRDLNRIKKIYNKFPLSDESKYFVDNLLNENEFGNINLSKETLTEYLTNKYGAYASKNCKIETNKFGTKAVIF